VDVFVEGISAGMLAVDTFVEGMIAEDMPAVDMLAEDTLAEDILAEDRLAVDMLAEDRLAEDMPAEDMSAVGIFLAGYRRLVHRRIHSIGNPAPQGIAQFQVEKIVVGR
jgi:hypothetical protein